jgi:hypothetical protein
VQPVATLLTNRQEGHSQGKCAARQYCCSLLLLAGREQ